MSCLPAEFDGFKAEILERYALACASAYVDPANIPLVIEDTSLQYGQYASEFAALGDPPKVRVTWNGLASLWACAQAIGRLGRRQFDAQRKRGTPGFSDKLMIDSDPELEIGLYFFALSLQLSKTKCDRWPDWVPKPNAAATETTAQDDWTGNMIFLMAFGWIARHELAHILLGHHVDGRPDVPESKMQREFEADAKATEWILVGHAKNKNQTPQETVTELDRRAFATFVGLIWICQFECVPHARSTTHPEGSERLRAVMDHLLLPAGSPAAEMLHYAIKTIIDPQGEWGPSDQQITTDDAALEAYIRLGRYIRDHT